MGVPSRTPSTGGPAIEGALRSRYLDRKLAGVVPSQIRDFNFGKIVGFQRSSIKMQRPI
jgi:hypothetical protein